MAHLIRYSQYTTQCLNKVNSPPGQIGEWQIVATSHNRIGLMKDKARREKNNPVNYTYEIISERQATQLVEEERRRNQQQQQRNWRRKKQQYDEEAEWKRRWRWRDPNKKRPGDW